MFSVVLAGFEKTHAQTTDKVADVTNTAVNTTVNAQAQQATVVYVPKAGTFALGASANIANIFTNSGDAVQVPTLCMQYYLGNKTALRATFGINSGSTLDKFYVRDDAAFMFNSLGNIQVVDTKKVTSNNYNSSLAIQQFFGATKLRGFIGLQAIYGAGSSNTMNAYANPMNILNPLPSSFNGAYANGQRVLEAHVSSTYSIGGGVIAGFQYFVLPRLSIGGEMSLNAIYSKAGQASSKSETMVNGAVVTVDQAVSPGSTKFEIKSLGYASKDMKEQIGFYVMYHF